MPANQQNIPELSISVNGAGGTLLASSSGKGETYLVYEPEYRPGDCLCVTTEAADQFLILQLDDALPPAYVYCKGTSLVFPVPFGEARKVYSERAFTGSRHYLHVRLARTEEIAARKNLALNPWATHEPGGPYPYASANKEASLHFSDGSSLVLSLKKTAAGQRFSFPSRRAEWVVLDSLIKADDPSPFPALTQMELWGRDINVIQTAEG